jgi:hypothetical protein
MIALLKDGNPEVKQEAINNLNEMLKSKVGTYILKKARDDRFTRETLGIL